MEKATPEQQKEIQKAFSEERVKLLWIGAKSGLLLFAANFISLSIGRVLFVDADVRFSLGYQTLAVVTNALFVSMYFTRQTNAVGDRVKDKIKDILKQ